MVMVAPVANWLAMVNATVIALFVTVATRSEAATVTATFETTPPRAPELTAVLGRSCVDETVTLTAPAVGAPVATLLNVHTLAVVSHPVVVVVRTNTDAVDEVAYATVAVIPVPPVHTTVGVEERKKPDGKLMMIWFAPAAA